MWETRTYEAFEGWVKATTVNGNRIRFKIADVKRYEEVGEHTKVKFYYGEEQLLNHPIEQLDKILGWEDEDSGNGEAQEQ